MTAEILKRLSGKTVNVLINIGGDSFSQCAWHAGFKLMGIEDYVAIFRSVAQNKEMYVECRHIAGIETTINDGRRPEPGEKEGQS